VVHARKHAERHVGIARKSEHGKEPATIADVGLSWGMSMGATAMVVMTYNAIRVDAYASALLMSTHTEIVGQAVNGPRRVKESQDRTWREGAKRIEKRDRNRDFDTKSFGKTCEHRLRK
jgi:hypothetical protein